MNTVRLPFDFDVDRMRQEIDALDPEAYYEIFNPYLEPNILMGFHLIDPELINGIPVFKANDHLKRSPYLLSILDQFKCDKETFRVHTLKEGTTIRRHRDIARNFHYGIIRVHIPVQNDDALYTYLDDERVVMRPGECWYMDLELPHEVQNKSSKPRIHLVMDCLRNEWWDEIMREAGMEITPQYVTPQ